MHLYAFGSICRGDIDEYSDVDLLAIVEDVDKTNLDPVRFSIYSYKRIDSLWREGNPFAWHLLTESKLLYSSTNEDFIQNLKIPIRYSKAVADCARFNSLFEIAAESLKKETDSYVFELANIFLAVRNFATCFALGHLNKMEFSRYSALRLGNDSLEIDEQDYLILQRARFLCTRGLGAAVSAEELRRVSSNFGAIKSWMNRLKKQLTNG